MVIKPKIRGFICTTAHPKGCEENVKRQIKYIINKGKFDGPKNVLIIGASTGYGLASRISLAFGSSSNTLGIMYEKESTERRSATPGFYNTKSFEKFAKQKGLYAETINGDAFSKEVKIEAIEKIKESMKKVDLVIYSLAAPKRKTDDGTVYSSVLKTTDKVFSNKSLDLRDNTIKEASVDVATEDDVENTVKVMGGEDWHDWIKILKEKDVLSDDAKTISYSYIGPKITYPIYFDGTIGQAKKNLCKTAYDINNEFEKYHVKAYISVNKALVTAASSAIPIVPLYIAILYKVMKKKNLHEGCIEQMYRLYSDKFITSKETMDEKSFIRMDDYEMLPDVQSSVADIFKKIDTDNVKTLADIDGYFNDFYHMFGFEFNNINYEEDLSEF